MAPRSSTLFSCSVSVGHGVSLQHLGLPQHGRRGEVALVVAILPRPDARDDVVDLDGGQPVTE
jgi:hypothetical protein